MKTRTIMIFISAIERERVWVEFDSMMFDFIGEKYIIINDDKVFYLSSKDYIPDAITSFGKLLDLCDEIKMLDLEKYATERTIQEGLEDMLKQIESRRLEREKEG